MIRQMFTSSDNRHALGCVVLAGKMGCLQILLNSILTPACSDKVVVVSNSTAALDLVQALCDTHSYGTVRIDGATDVNKRQDIVNSFNTFGTAKVSKKWQSAVKPDCIMSC